MTIFIVAGGGYYQNPENVRQALVKSSPLRAQHVQGAPSRARHPTPHSTVLQVPRALRWLPQASLIKHSFEAFCVNEFPGLTFKSETKAGKRLAGPDESGEQVWGLHRGPFVAGTTAPGCFDLSMLQCNRCHVVTSRTWCPS